MKEKLALRKYLDDFLALAGGALITVGVWQIYPPAAWIVAGVMLIALGVLYGLGGKDDHS